MKESGRSRKADLRNRRGENERKEDKQTETKLGDNLKGGKNKKISYQWTFV
jgi:hypothetical protein